MESYFEQGSSRKDCELKIAEKYRQPFRILSEKQIKLGGFLGIFSRPGVEVEFYFSPTLNRSQPVSGYHPPPPASWHAASASAAPETFPAISRNIHADLEEEKRKVIAAAGKSYEQVSASNAASQKILESLDEIKKKIETGGKAEEHPAFKKASDLLRQNDFSQSYIDAIMERLRKELPLEKLENQNVVNDKMLEWIGESINIYKEEEFYRKPRVMVLIGPTGVGKTTTISKLATIYGIGTEGVPAIDVRMITIDGFKIGAKEQLERIGDIMYIPVSYVDNKQSLKKEIALYSDDIDLFLIDTIGRSPKKASELGEMKEILEGCGKHAEYHLVVSAATKTSVIEDIMQQFEPFNYKSVIFTKTDEIDCIGNVISAISEKKKPVFYFTDGQDLLGDIKRASVVHFLMNLDGFNIDRNKIEKRFPSGEAEQFKWS